MIQRIQSLYLLLSGLLMSFYFLFIDTWREYALEQGYDWAIPVVIVWSVLLGLASIGAIFLYQQRERQRKSILVLQWLVLLFTLFLYAILFMAGYIRAVMASGPLLSDAFALLLPLIVYGLLYLARRGVERDIALIRSMDRLR